MTAIINFHEKKGRKERETGRGEREREKCICSDTSRVRAGMNRFN